MVIIKKVMLLITSILLISGCSFNKNDGIKSFIKHNENNTTYELKGTMSIINNEDEFTYDVTVGVNNKELYKVDLINKINEHEQVILKNKDGVYVVTPSLNKSYKFASNWPNNSSQIYLIERIIYDVENNESTIKETKEGYEITSKVDYPNNQSLRKEKIIVDKNYNIKEIYVYDDKDTNQLSFKISDINYKPTFNDDYFKLENLVTEIEECENDDCKTKNTSSELNDIIYPLYVPADTYLKSKDTVSSETGARHILTFEGTNPFILVEEAATTNAEMEVIPVTGDPLLLSNTIGALSSNSLYWTSNGIDYYLTSSTLNNNEMTTIAESITNSTSLVSKEK